MGFDLEPYNIDARRYTKKTALLAAVGFAPIFWLFMTVTTMVWRVIQCAATPIVEGIVTVRTFRRLYDRAGRR